MIPRWIVSIIKSIYAETSDLVKSDRLFDSVAMWNNDTIYDFFYGKSHEWYTVYFKYQTIQFLNGSKI